MYAPYCLAELIAHLEANPDCAAATAHQRIMSPRDQADPDDRDAQPAVAAFLRRVQSFDFESGLVVFNGMHALAGFLPVVPGPCGMFRASAMSQRILERVRAICVNPTHKDGLVQGNLKIAEDRIVSYLLILGSRAERAWETHWVSGRIISLQQHRAHVDYLQCSQSDAHQKFISLCLLALTGANHRLLLRSGGNAAGACPPAAALAERHGGGLPVAAASARAV